MPMDKLRLVGAAIIAAAGMTLSTPASAGTGCNGIINPFVWGCAPWDNNNGPKFPYYKVKRIVIPTRNAKVETLNGARMVTDLRNGQRYPLIGNDTAGMVAAGGMN